MSEHTFDPAIFFAAVVSNGRYRQGDFMCFVLDSMDEDDYDRSITGSARKAIKDWLRELGEEVIKGKYTWNDEHHNDIFLDSAMATTLLKLLVRKQEDNVVDNYRELVDRANDIAFTHGIGDVTDDYKMVTIAHDYAARIYTDWNSRHKITNDFLAAFGITEPAFKD